MWSNNYAMQKQWIHMIHSSALETPAYSKNETVQCNEQFSQSIFKACSHTTIPIVKNSNQWSFSEIKAKSNLTNWANASMMNSLFSPDSLLILYCRQ